jgi:hypothetical protein
MLIIAEASFDIFENEQLKNDKGQVGVRNVKNPTGELNRKLENEQLENVKEDPESPLMETSIMLVYMRVDPSDKNTHESKVAFLEYKSVVSNETSGNRELWINVHLLAINWIGFDP